MPSRILREGYVTSERVAQMEPGSQDRFPRYWLAADDFGCFRVQPQVLAGKIFPLRQDMTPARISADLAEFERVGCLKTWRTDTGSTYAFFPGWWEHNRRPRKGSKRKTPKPPHPCADPPAANPGEDPDSFDEPATPAAQQSLPIRCAPAAEPRTPAADARAPAPAVRSSQSQFAVQSQAQDPPIPPASGGPSVPGLRVVKDPETPLVEPVRLQKRKRPGRTLAEDVENERQTLRDNRSRSLWRWLKEWPRETWNEEAQAFMAAAPPTQEAQLEWVQQHCRASPEEAADIVAIVAALISPPEVRNGNS